MLPVAEYISAGHYVIMEGAIIPIWRQLPDIVNDTLVRRKRSDLKIEFRRAALVHNMTPNTSPDKCRHYSCQSSVLQEVS